MKNILAAFKVLYTNRKAEIALAVGALALVREIVQAATGH
jgi:hypothetical protein